MSYGIMHENISGKKLNPKGDAPEVVGHPYGYNAPHHDKSFLHQNDDVYFVMIENVPDKTCFEREVEAKKRLNYYKYQTGRLGSQLEVAKTPFHNWKIISGYNEAKKRKRDEYLTVLCDSWGRKKREAIFERAKESLDPARQKRMEQNAIEALADEIAPKQKQRKKAIYKYLYFVECEQPEESDCRLIKVGVSERPQERVRILQIGCPFDLQLIHKVGGNEWACSMEKWLHQKMEKICQRGEWFQLQSSQLDNIKNFLNDDRVLCIDGKSALRARDKSDKQKEWDKIWEEHYPFSNRDWMVLNA